MNICGNCNNEFDPKQKHQQYCSVKCRKSFNRNKEYKYSHTCKTCGKITDHVRKNTYGKIKSRLGNSNCSSCRQIGKIKQCTIEYKNYNFWIDSGRYFRYCSGCNTILEYKKKYYAYQACLNDSKCLSCSSYGLENGKVIQTLYKYNVNTIDEYESLLPKKTLYYRKVWAYTNKQDLLKLPNINLRGKNSYALDHIFPIAEGFRRNIPAELIGSFENLQMLPCRENESKNDTITIIPEHIQTYIDTNNIFI